MGQEILSASMNFCTAAAGLSPLSTTITCAAGLLATDCAICLTASSLCS
jgi:hypothetical protein